MVKKEYFQKIDMVKRVVSDLSLYKTKLVLEMAELKFAAIIFGFFFYPLYTWTIFDNFGDFKSLVALLFTVIVGSIRFQRWLKKDKLVRQRMDMDNQMRQLELREKEISVRERELSIMEREDDHIRKKYK